MIDILVRRNIKAIKHAEEELETYLSTETNNIPEQYLESLFNKIEKLIDHLSALNRRGGYYEFKKSNNNK